MHRPAHKCVCDIMIVSIEERAMPDSPKISCGLVGAVPGQVSNSCLVVSLYSKPYRVSSDVSHRASDLADLAETKVE